jgi:hypothetical protein
MKPYRMTVGALAVAALLPVTADAAPEPDSGVSLRFGGGRLESSLDRLAAVSESPFIGGTHLSLSYGRRIASSTWLPTHWRLQLGWDWLGSQAPSLGSDVRLDVHRPVLRGELHWEVADVVSPYVAVEAGAELARLRLDAGEGDFAQRHVADATAAGFAGVEVRGGDRSASGGLFAEVGGSWSSGLDFDRVEDADGRAFDAGTIDLTGWRWRLGVVGTIRW